MDIEELKQQWQSMSIRLDKLERQTAKALRTKNASDTQHRLARNYRRLSLSGWALIPLALLMYYILHSPVWLCAIYAGFGIFMAIADLRLAQYIDSNNYYSMPIVDAIDHAIKIRKKQQRILFYGVIGATLVLVPFFVDIYNNQEFGVFLAGVVGFIIGLAIGITNKIRFFRMSRRIFTELKEYADESETEVEQL